MWRWLPSGDPVARQVRRVRRRRNLHAAQLGLYGVAAALGAASAAVVVLALTAGTRGFALGALAAGGGAVAAASGAARAAARRWTPGRRAARWVDDTAGLGGRLATLVELRGRDGAFVPLLVAQNLERLDAWRPERLVPRRVPWLALGAALAGVYGFLLALAVAPRLVPPATELVWSEQPLAPLDLAGDAEGGEAPRRLVVSPLAGEAGAGGGAALPGAGIAPRERGARAGAPQTLQDRIRRSLWGERFTSAATAAATGRPGTQHGRGAEPSAPGARGQREGRASREGATEGAAAGTNEPATASGAGTGTDPELFAVDTDDEAAADGRFALGLAARVHGPRGAPRPPSGEAPPAEPDARPPLAPGPRDATAPRRPAVPAEYEAVVRALFAHRPEEDR